ncbi:hypothetical protein WMF20_22315 [Sorangium sp. So ce834]|uniref:hypothetical protein n=1 Tax=Sorangium sp. So ce834 TaxID=3133321 RepID=UPI003F619260
MGHRSALVLVVMAAAAFALGGCNRGYQTAAELESAERGPTHCASSCYSLGMRMSAFVLVDRAVAGCVCEPVQAPAGPYAAPPAAVPPPPAAAPPAAAPPAAVSPAVPPPAAAAPAAQPQSRASVAAAAGYAVIEAHRKHEEDQQALRATQPK